MTGLRPDETPRLSLFVTGGAGFIGRRLVAALAENPRYTLTLLLRGPAPVPPPPGVRLQLGDLLRPQEWASALEGCDVVLHLAALTGKAGAQAHRRANLDATVQLLERARAAGVRRFAFVSSIAAGYGDRRHYHYANAKAAAESAVLASGLDALVVRPTMVLGPGSPVLANLRRLARLPTPIAFGADRPVQPVHVDDVVSALVAALALPAWNGAIVELGGPRTIGTDELVARIRAADGLPPRRPLRLPLAPLRSILAALEPIALPLLPFSAGQLAAFANPSVARGLPGSLPLPAPMHDLDAMLGRSANGA